MIKTNSGVQIQKLQMPFQQLSPFNGQIRFSNPYSETPSTPSKSFISQQIRGSQTFTPVKNQQSFQLKENNFNIETKIQSLVNENMFLNQQLEKIRNEQFNFEKQSHNLQQIKQRVQKLEDLVDSQQNEIEVWKLKYQKAAAGESRIEMQQMENQILNVIQENERLNQLLIEKEESYYLKEQELKTIIQKNIQLENELKKQKEKSKNIEKTNKPAVQCCAFQSEKKVFKSSQNDMRSSKGKLVENDIQNRKKSEHSSKQIQKMEIDLTEMQKQIITLESDKNILMDTIAELQLQLNETQEKLEKQNEKQQVQPNLITDNNNIVILKQEVQNQQILILEELKKFKLCQQQNQQMKEKFYQFEEFLKAFNSTLPNSDDTNIETAIEEFQSSQANCLKILDSIDKK